jgi:hypothetical protein
MIFAQPREQLLPFVRMFPCSWLFQRITSSRIDAKCIDIA